MLIIFTNERANFSEFQFCWKISLVGKRTGKSIATLTKKQRKWSVINRRTYYESKAISGLIARILIDIFDSSPGRGEGRGKGGSDRWHACPNDDCSREIGYLHRVIKFLLLSILQFQIRERKVSIEQTPLSNRPCSPPCYLRIAFRRNPFKNLSSTCALSRSWKNRSSKRISSRFLEDYRFLPMIRKKERERERGSPVFHGSLFAKPRRSIQQVNSWIERSKSTCSN